MNYPKPKTEEEAKKFRRMAYESEKAGLIDLFHEQKYNEKTLNTFLVNSLKKDFEEELKEDGLLK